jgi:hypothetical protein
MRGFLFKQTVIRSGNLRQTNKSPWKQRYFVLRRGSLNYYSIKTQQVLKYQSISAECKVRVPVQLPGFTHCSFFFFLFFLFFFFLILILRFCSSHVGSSHFGYQFTVKMTSTKEGGSWLGQSSSIVTNEFRFAAFSEADLNAWMSFFTNHEPGEADVRNK